MSDPGCFFHGDEPIQPNHTTICGECGHAFTDEELIAEDLAIRQDAYGGDDESLVSARSTAEIMICPLCTHDF